MLSETLLARLLSLQPISPLPIQTLSLKISMDITSTVEDKQTKGKAEIHHLIVIQTSFPIDPHIQIPTLGLLVKFAVKPDTQHSNAITDLTTFLSMKHQIHFFASLTSQSSISNHGTLIAGLPTILPTISLA